MRFAERVLRLALVIGAGALLIAGTVIGVVPRLWKIANAHHETPVVLPEFSEIAERSYAYDTAGNLIAIFEVENSQPVHIDQVPDHVIDAFLAVEDEQFWTHHGVNVRGLTRAVLSNFASDNMTQGASTITMQVVKNDYLGGFERDSRYKAVQIAYAVRLEKQMTKREILQRYLNTVHFGENAYGIAAAAETYFGKEVAELTMVEGAFLAGLVQAPSAYNPIRNPEPSRARFNIVLDRLVDVGMLTESEREQVDATFVLPERARRRESQRVPRTYYTEALSDYLLNRSDILGETYQERYNLLNRGGLRIHTTLDPVLQANAESARNLLPDNEYGIDAALTSLDVNTGAVRAMVGGRGFVPGEREVNLALAPSQTGSSIKIFILAAALQAGATPEDLLNGYEPCYLPSGDPSKPTFELRGGHSGGVAPLRYHTTASINCAFARLSQIVGLNRVVNTTYRMASSPYLYLGQPETERRPIQPFASFATGANELSTLDMAAGVQSIANAGVHHDPYYVEHIDDAAGTRLYTHNDEGTRVLDRDVALEAIDIMKGVLTGGTARRELSGFGWSRPAFGKTGTQQNNWTAFFVGATPELATAVMVRDPDRYTPMVNIPEFTDAGVYRVNGGTFPARIWREFMETTGLESTSFDDWDPLPAPPRSPARLYLPGNECVYRIVGYDYKPEPVTLPPGVTTLPPPPPPPGVPPPPPPTVIVSVPIYELVTSGTSIPPDVLDPHAPLPSVAYGVAVMGC